MKRNQKGFGSVITMKDTPRRNKFWARKSRISKTTKKREYINIGYYSTRQEAWQALADVYGKSFDALRASQIHFETLFSEWQERGTRRLSESNIKALTSAYNSHCQSLVGLAYNDITLDHMQTCVDDCGRGAQTQGHIRNLFLKLDAFHKRIGGINNSYAELIETDTAVQSNKHVEMDINDVKKIIAHPEVPWSEIIVIGVYSGWRVHSELLDLKLSNIDINNWIFKAGAKTKAGKGESGEGRKVPIHSAIQELVKRLYDSAVANGQTYLFEVTGKHITQSKLRVVWDKTLFSLNMTKVDDRGNTVPKYIPHDCRTTFESALNRVGVPLFYTQKMVGHAGRNVDETTYFKTNVEELRKYIEMIKY